FSSSVSNWRSSVAWARSSELQAANPRPPGSSFTTRRSRRPATSAPDSTCACNKPILVGVFVNASVFGNPRGGPEMISQLQAELEKPGRYEHLRPRIYSMDRKTQADEIRRLSAAPDVMLGSVHAVTETGTLVAASMSGSQLGPYVSGAGRVIFVVGTQKIVSDLEEGLRRINEYAYRLEDARAQAAYGVRSAVNKVLVINREITAGRITVVLVDEVLGF